MYGGRGITEAIRCYAYAVYDVGRSDDEIERFTTEFETICQKLQQITPFVYHGEAVSNFRKNARRDRI
ncbi:hypothetical protein ACWFPY_25285 [Nocardia fluminea]